MQHRLPTMLRRLAWFAGLWAAGVLALAAIGYVLRLALGA
jgi:Protein of unknown function (DUF2474)